MTKLPIRKDVPLAPLTNFRIGGPAEYFVQVESTADIEHALSFSQRNALSVTVIGLGTNILVPDTGIHGLVIQMKNNLYRVHGHSGTLLADAGTDWNFLVQNVSKDGWSGLEWGVGIPGTVGGAVYGNAGAFGGEVKDALLSVLAYDTKDGALTSLKHKDCAFTYRHSLFKSKRYLIVSTSFQLQEKDPKDLIHQMKETLQFRKKKHATAYPTCGSYFKNILFGSIPRKIQKELLSSPVGHLAKNYRKVPAGFLIESCGLKGMQKGGAKVSEKHANFLINYKNARAQDILDLATIVKETVFSRYGILLEEEVQYLGN
ncbi:MAG TPA: UDP-N-acetylmuramate dehydrogenase [Patescibacteria group bacterium]|nr:UDP-N-acetylmuramate dehydrogenase [Patescibacteria group bacterium]